MGSMRQCTKHSTSLSRPLKRAAFNLIAIYEVLKPFYRCIKWPVCVELRHANIHELHPVLKLFLELILPTDEAPSFIRSSAAIRPVHIISMTEAIQ
jgi:hypothetical protein